MTGRAVTPDQSTKGRNAWSLGIDGWRLCACMVGITLIQDAMAVHAINSEADRGQR